jgi:ATP-dependent Clp protease adaptor protein ClpS
MESFSKKWESDPLSKGESSRKSLTLHNDNINSFDFVIDSLREICEHDEVQAEQCAFLTHFTGKCQIKLGPEGELMPLKEKLSSKNLSVTID